jgi:hypothetical protein
MAGRLGCWGVLLAVFANGAWAQDPDGTFAGAVPARLGGVVSGGSISPAGDLDFLVYEVPESGMLTLESIGSTDVYGSLYDSRQHLIAADDDSGEGTNFRISTSVVAGRYYLRVRHFSTFGTGSYSIRSGLLPGWGPPPDPYMEQFDLVLSGNPLRATASGRTLQGGGSSHVYDFRVPSGGILRAESSGATDVLGTLYQGTSRFLAQDDDSGAGANFLIQRRVSAGLHRVIVRPYSAWSGGTYGLVLTFTPDGGPAVLPPNSFGTARQLDIANGAAAASESIGQAGENDYFALIAPSRGVLTVSTSGTTDTVGTLFDRNRRVLAVNDDHPAVGTNFLIRREIPSGPHFLRVRHYRANETGDYLLHVKFESTGPGPRKVRRAVVIGISDYASLQDLRYGAADARSMRDLLRRSGWDVTLLLDRAATKAAILSTVRQELSGAAEFLLTFSGRGTSVGPSAYICPYDGREPRGFLSGGELAALFRHGGGGAQIGLILDTGYSVGGSSAGGAGEARTLRGLPQAASSSGSSAGLRLGRTLQSVGCTVLAGCRSTQAAYEAPVFGHGWFTGRVLALAPARATDADRNGDASLEEIYRRAASGYRGIQHPQLFDGNPAEGFDVGPAYR